MRVISEDLINAIWSPRLEEICNETKSEIIVEEDRSCVQIRLVSSDQTWFKYRLRDRSFDGLEWKATPLVDWQYDGVRDSFPASAVEESIYCLDPRYALTSVFSEEIADFIKNPFEVLPYSAPSEDNLRDWLRKWQFVFSSENILYPGYFAMKNIPWTRKKIHKNVLQVLKTADYDYLTAVPTWWHTVSIYTHLGFKFLYPADQLRIEDIGRLLTIKEDDTEICRRQSSWIVMLQFWAEIVVKCGLKPEDFGVLKKHIFRDSEGKILTFPLTPKNNLWLFYKV